MTTKKGVAAQPHDPDALLTPAHVAHRLGVHTKTLARWRVDGDGPRYIKLAHNLVRYREADLTRFLEACSRDNTARN